MDINTYVDKIFFINMDKDTDRLADVLQQFEKHGITNYERIPGIEVDIEEANKFRFLGPYGGADRDKYYKKSAGCMLSHKKAIEMSKERGYKRVLIMEDDFKIVDNFAEKFSQVMTRFTEDAIPWNLLWLGLCRWQNVTTNKPINDYLMKIVGGGCCTFAYIINANFYDLVLANIDWMKVEYDIMFNSMTQQLKHAEVLKLSDELVIHVHDLERYK